MIAQKDSPIMLATSLLPTTSSPPTTPAPTPPPNLSSLTFMQEVVSNPNIPHFLRMDAAKFILKNWPHLAYPPSHVFIIPDMGL
jgi:hypothetical protein